MCKATVISEVSNDPSWRGSLKQALSGAREIDPSINLDDVRLLTVYHVKRKKQVAGQNLLVGHEPHLAYQLDLMFIKHLDDLI